MKDLSKAEVREFREALHGDDVKRMSTVLDDAIARHGLESWAPLKVPDRPGRASLLREAADFGARKCFAALTAKLHEKSLWETMDEDERRKRSLAFLMTLGSFHDKLLKLGLLEAGARENLVVVLVVFFAKDGDQPQAAIDDFKRLLPDDLKSAAAEAGQVISAEFERAAIAALLDTARSVPPKTL